MKTVAIIQARLGSRRLPRKVLADLHGKPLIDHVVERAWMIQGIDSVVLNIPHGDHALSLGRDCAVFPVKDQEEDVLGSYLTVAEAHGADVIVRLTGDCPLLAPDLISKALAAFKINYGAELYLPLCMPYCRVADGWDAEIFTMDLLREAAEQAGPDEREHVTTWMRHDDFIRMAYYPESHDYTALKCSVDTVEDLERVRTIMGALDDPQDFSHTATWNAWQKTGRP